LHGETQRSHRGSQSFLIKFLLCEPLCKLREPLCYFINYVCQMNSIRQFVILSVILVLGSSFTKAQSTYLPINSFTNYNIDRLDISENTNVFNTSLKPYLRNSVNYVGLYFNEPVEFSKLNNRYILDDNFEYSYYDTFKYEIESFDIIHKPWKLFKKRLYAVPSALFSLKTYSEGNKDLTLIINPVLGFSGGKDFNNSTSTFQNTRGIEVRGSIDNKVGFYSYLTENQFRFPNYYNQIIDSTGVIPGNGFHKPFGSNAHDFFMARGYITFSPTKHIGMQFGHDRNFIGNGYRSLILSNFSNPYLFLKINTKIWRFNYQNLFTQLTDFTSQSASGEGVKPKYFVNHYLGIKLFKTLNIGFFESVVYDRSDSIHKGSFDINYLNPVIFYRAIEHNLNSSDNVIVGMDWKWNFKKRFSFYGQFVLDEFIKNEMIKRTGSWVNKFGVQTGLKYINAFTVKGLDLQVEYNAVRPYTYTHFKQSQNYVNYNQALAHPFGANFKEAIFIAKYQPFYNLFIETGFIYVMKGLDSNSSTKHFGGNILTTYENRPNEKGLKIGQGVKTNYSIFFLNASYMLYHNLWIDARANIRAVKSDLAKYQSNTNWFQLGLRMNLDMRNYDF
jgi:hypothetical protein